MNTKRRIFEIIAIFVVLILFDIAHQIWEWETIFRVTLALVVGKLIVSEIISEEKDKKEK